MADVRIAGAHRCPAPILGIQSNYVSKQICETLSKLPHPYSPTPPFLIGGKVEVRPSLSAGTCQIPRITLSNDSKHDQLSIVNGSFTVIAPISVYA